MKCIDITDADLCQEDSGCIDFFSFVRKQEHLPGWDVLSQHLTAAVVDPAAGPGQRQPPESIVLGQIPPCDTVNDLEVGETKMKKAQNGEGEDEERRGAAAKWSQVLTKLHSGHRSFLAR